MLAAKNWLQAYTSAAESRQLSTQYNYFSQGKRDKIWKRQNSGGWIQWCGLVSTTTNLKQHFPHCLSSTWGEPQNSDANFQCKDSAFNCRKRSVDFSNFSKLSLVYWRAEFHLLLFKWGIITFFSKSISLNNYTNEYKTKKQNKTKTLRMSWKICICHFTFC